jgi:hypothetical protein
VSTRTAIALTLAFALIVWARAYYERGELPFITPKTGLCVVKHRNNDMAEVFAGPGGARFCGGLVANDYDLEEVFSEDNELAMKINAFELARTVARTTEKKYSVTCKLSDGKMMLTVLDTGGQILGELACRHYFDNGWKRSP